MRTEIRIQRRRPARRSHRVARAAARSVYIVYVINKQYLETYTCKRPTRVIYIYIYKYKNTKKPKLQNLQNKYLQNMNYVIYRYYKTKIGFVWKLSKLSKNPKKSNVFWHVWCILYNKLLFWVSDSDSVYLTLYGNIL